MGYIYHSALTEPEIAVALSQDRSTDRGAGEAPLNHQSLTVWVSSLLYLRKIELVGWGMLLAL